MSVEEPSNVYIFTIPGDNPELPETHAEVLSPDSLRGILAVIDVLDQWTPVFEEEEEPQVPGVMYWEFSNVDGKWDWERLSGSLFDSPNYVGRLDDESQGLRDIYQEVQSLYSSRGRVPKWHIMVLRDVHNNYQVYDFDSHEFLNGVKLALPWFGLDPPQMIAHFYENGEEIDIKE